MIRIAQNVLCLLRKTGGIANGKKKEQKNYCEKNRAEVVAMSIFEYNEEEEKRKIRKAEYEAGKNDGIKIGREEEKRKIANSLFKEGDSIEKVARILCESEETIRGWVDGKMNIKVE